MQVRNDALSGVLARAQRAGALPPVFVVAGDEALLSLEAQDAIRSTARGLGYTERILMAKGFITKTPKGRLLTQHGIRRARSIIASNKETA